MTFTTEQDKDGFRWYVSETGQRYISVTSAMDHIVPKSLQNWMRKNSQKKSTSILEHASAHGTRIHRQIELAHEGHAQTGPEIEAFTRVTQQARLELKATEQVVWSDLYGYAGRLDHIYERDGIWMVGDLKTGNAFSPKTGWQLSAYLNAYNERGPEHRLSGMVGVHIPRDAPERAKVFEYTQLDFAFNSFLSCLHTFKGLYWRALKKQGWQWLERPIFE